MKTNDWSYIGVGINGITMIKPKISINISNKEHSDIFYIMDWDHISYPVDCYFDTTWFEL